MDLIYIENYSFLLDLKLMILTLRVVMMPDKTEGIQQGERMAQTKKPPRNSLAPKFASRSVPCGRIG